VATSGTLRAHLEIYGPAGVFVADNGFYNDKTTVVSLPSTGTYTVLVRDYALTASGGYDVYLQFTTPGRCGRGITCGDTLDGAIVAIAQIDSYFFVANAGERVFMTAVSSSGTLRAHLAIYDPNGTFVADNGFYNAATANVTMPLSGTYTVLVYDYSLTATGSHDVSLRFTTGRCGTGLARGQTLGGSITKVAQVDAYVTCGVQGSSLIASAVATSGTLRAHLDIYDPAGNKLGDNGFYNGPSPSIPLASTGPHTIVVYDYGLRGTGTYNVNATFTGATCLLPAPTIVSSPSNRTVRAGQTAQFTSLASGIPAPTYRWQVSFNGGGSWTNLTDGAGFTGSTTNLLTIRGVGAGLNQAQYRSIATNGVAAATIGPATLTVKPGSPPGDYDGDQRIDLTVYRPSTGNWYVKQSGSQYATYLAYQLGEPDDTPTPGDYDGDGRADFGVYHAGEWRILRSSSHYTTLLTLHWGQSGDIPVPGDYDGDGRTDIAIYRPSSGDWYILQSSTNYGSYIVQRWGSSADVPVPGDYDGDSRTDLALYRPGTGYWYVLLSSSGYGSYIARQWGIGTDVVAPGDYDGDGKADLGVFRPATGSWYILTSSTGFAGYLVQTWGISTDIVAPGDYDGDGKTDFGVFRPSTGYWYVLTSIIGDPPYLVQPWGLDGDVPAPSAP
jgi:hypothetical protein